MPLGRPNTSRPRVAERPARGPIAAVRAWSSAGAAAGSIAVVAAWTAGLVFNDRWLWSQWLWWLPTAMAALGAWSLVVASRLIDRRAARGLRRIGVGTALAVTLSLGIEARPRAPLNPALSAGDGEAIRVAYWNLSWADPAGAAGVLDRGDLSADVLVIANPRPGRSELPEAIAARFAAPPPTDPLEPARGAAYIARTGFTTIGSRFPIRAHGRVGLSGFRTSWARARLSNTESGVIFVEIDHPTIGTLTLWIVDLPSDPTVHREAMLERMADDIAAWDRRVTRPDGIGRWRSAVDEGRASFPRPDIVVGDFNTPRGSRSLRALVGDLAESHAAVGLGFGHTWPRPLPLWAIDLAFTDPESVRAVRTETIDTGHALHHAIRVTAVIRPE